MMKSPKKPESKPEEVEVEPDAWERFQRTMDKVVPPKPKPKDDGGDSDG